MKFNIYNINLRHILGIGLSLSLLFLFSACEQGPPENSKMAQKERGRALFEKYCFSCHGNNGDGAVADTLKTRPMDLTKIVKRRNVKSFPVQEIAKYIDGRHEVEAHGPREMPVWGNDLKDLENLNSEKELRGKLGELIAYLMSIQE